MSDKIKLGALDEANLTDIGGGRTITDFTQVASCAVGEQTFDGIRLSLREKLEREKAQRQKALEKTLTRSFRNLIKGF